MPRPRRHIFYSMQVPGKWWCPALGKFVDFEQMAPHGGSSQRRFTTARRAFAALDCSPKGSALYRRTRHPKGGWRVVSWLRI